jgi:hypothetical protein
MKRNSIKLLTAALLLATGQQAFAAATGTLAGQVVTNQASVSYTVNSVTQTAVVNDPKAAFTVDRKVNLTVSASEPIGSPKGVAPKALSQMLTYTVTNLTNDTMDFSLDTANATGDDFDLDDGTWVVAVDNPSAGTPGVYDAADTATSINDLASGDARKVFVFSTIPDLNGTTIANDKKSGIVLTATALTSAGAALSDDSSSPDADNTGGAPGYTAGTIQNVFADDDELGAGAGLHNAMDADTGYYKIETAAISVNKTSFVLWDPINLYIKPKAIPGAILVYCITVTNPSSTTQASAIDISDVIDDTYLNYQGQTPGDNNGLALQLSEGTAPTCDATLVNTASDTTSGTAGDAVYSAAIDTGSMLTDTSDADTGSYDSGAHTVHASTPVLDKLGVGQDNVATAVFRVKIK